MEEPDELQDNQHLNQHDESTELERQIDAAILQAASELADLQQKVQDAVKAVDDNMRKLQALKVECGKPLQGSAVEFKNTTEITTEPEICTSDQSTGSEDGHFENKSCSNSPPAEDGEINSPV